jgi:hypothetical protein
MRSLPGLWVLAAVLAPAAVGIIEIPAQGPPTYCGCPAPCVEVARKAGMKTPEEIQYWRAIHNSSTANSFVVVTVTDVNTGVTTTYCTGANFLLGAIHREYGLSYAPEGEAKAIEIAMKASGHHFVLQRRAALKNISQCYTAEELSWARESIAEFSTEELVKGLGFEGALHGSLSISHRYSSYRSFAFALGQALYERGLSVGQGCVSSQIWVCD